MQAKSIAHVDCIISGHRVVGWSDDDPQYEWEGEDVVDVKYGGDGGTYVKSMPMFGQNITIKVMPTSPTCQWAMQQEQLRKNSHLQRQHPKVYDMTLTDSVQGVSWQAAGGYIINFPVGNIAGQTYEFKMGFEQVTAQVDGGRFQAPLSSIEAG